MLKITQLLTVLCFILGTSTVASAQTVEEKISAALAMTYRTDAEITRDTNRSPLEALLFMGLQDDMKVIEYAPARQAWYTKILAPVLSEKGQLYLIDSQSTFDGWGDMLENPVFNNTQKITVDLSWNSEAMRYDLGELNIGIEDADLFLNIREYHNFSIEDKARFNKAAFNALKSGGRYVVIDHTRRPNQIEDANNFRREDPVQVIQQIQAAGFILDKTSDMFYKPGDTLELEVGHQSVRGKTDRFFLVFRKP